MESFIALCMFVVVMCPTDFIVGKCRKTAGDAAHLKR
jgi:hypothetical protein